MTDCPHGAYYIARVVGGRIDLSCRCLICPRCRQHTGNATQGHFWRFCEVTGTYRTFHLCCPNDCELEATT